MSKWITMLLRRIEQMQAAKAAEYDDLVRV